jgi:indolepyruvate ferredoxin oxidoreductase, alpha subunit
MYNGVIRACNGWALPTSARRDGRADLCAERHLSRLISSEFLDFCEGKDQVLVIEEGQPEFIEQPAWRPSSTAPVRTVRPRQGPTSRWRGNTPAQVMLNAMTAFLKQAAPHMLPAAVRAPNEDRPPSPT